MENKAFIGIIYIHKNKINGKCYVGQTTKKTAEIRWGINGSNYNRSKKFWRAIKKYGWDNFEHIILEEVYFTIEDLNNAEIKFIKEYDSYKNGYNSTIGGDDNPMNHKENREKISLSLKGRKVSEETRKKLSESHKGIPQGPLSEEHKKKISKATKLRLEKHPEQHPTKGKKLSKKHKEKLAVSKIGDKNPMYGKPMTEKIKKTKRKQFLTNNPNAGGKLNYRLKKEILQYDLEGNFIKKWDSKVDAEKELNISIHVKNLNKPSCGGFMWRYYDKENEIIKKIDPVKNKVKRRVLQYDLEGNFIKKWNSQAEAKKELKIKSNISDVCTGRLNSAGGFIWKYESDINKED